MQPIEPPDTHHLSAAVGWLELGNLAEAEADLNRIAPEQQTHPDVLEVRWIILAQKKLWEAALDTARVLVEVAPDRASGWLHQAYALRRAKNRGLQLAWEALLPAYEKFPNEPTIAYNLSCYACQMHQLDEARQWLTRAISVGSKEIIKKMALDDSDLESLWPEIREL
jgi:tetratricopeptide (TPR) repeat protein